MSATIRSPRGAAGMAAITLAMLVVLIGLGVWQLQRKQEKRLLISALTQRLAEGPVALPAPASWPTLAAATDEFRRVRFTAQGDTRLHAHVFASGSALRSDISGLGAWEFAPLRLPSGETLVVNLGFVPDGQAPSPLDPDRPLTLTGYLRFAEQPGWLTPQPDLTKRQWFARDSGGMARALGWGEVAPFYVDLESPVPASGWPKPGALEVNLRDPHLQYALTWFGLAAVVVVAFGVWMAGRRQPAP
jgi:cytochrome oxidase assembly protein ShyY1